MGKGQVKELILRDYLAVDRTKLANERTFLAFLRTSLTMIVAGASGLHFFEHPGMRVIGWVLILFGLVCSMFGFASFRRLQRSLGSLSKGEYFKQ